MTLISWQQALAWRLGRHLLDPVGDLPVEAVVERLCGVQSQVASSADLAVRLRRRDSRPDEVNAALADGRLLKTWAMRGTLHLIPPDLGAAFLSLIADARPWERPSWQRYFGMTPDRTRALRDAVRTALDGTILTREELIDAVVAQPGLDDIGEALRSGWGSLLKPLAWQGELCHGPSRGDRVTFMRPEAASRRWTGLPAPDVAASTAIVAYLAAHGPATADSFGQWLAGGFFGKRRLRGWFEALGDRLATVEVEGEPRVLLTEDLDDLASTSPTKVVRLLPGFDQYVLAPGTADGHVVPPTRRALVSRQSGWISPVVVSGGTVSGTWELEGDDVVVSWFRESGTAPGTAIGAEVERLGSMVGRELRPRIDVV